MGTGPGQARLGVLLGINVRMEMVDGNKQKERNERQELNPGGVCFEGRLIIHDNKCRSGTRFFGFFHEHLCATCLFGAYRP